MTYTRDETGLRKLYVDGVEVASSTVGGTFENWDESFKLAFGNEFTMNRPWLGELHDVAIYSVALIASKVQHNCSLMPPLVTATFISSQDSYVQENDDDRNYGTSNRMRVRTESDNRNRRSFVQFDLSEIPEGSMILSATLRIWRESGASSVRQHEARMVLDFWLENAITWEDQPGIHSAQSDVIDVGDPDMFKEWDVMSNVQDFVDGPVPNYGWRIGDVNEGASSRKETSYSTREDANPDIRPQLVIYYLAA